MAVTVQARRVVFAPGFVVAVEQASGLSWLSFGRPLPALATVPSQFWEGSHGLRKAMTIATAELIPVHTNPDGGKAVMGRDLHEFLEVTTPYQIWFPRMVEYGFTAGQDFLNNSVQNSNRGRPKQDHIITLDMAKEISMIQRTERGKQARRYFIECERRMKQPQPELTPEQLMAKALPCSKPYLNIRLQSIIVVVSFYKDLNQARFTRNKLGQCTEPRSRSKRSRGFA